MLSSFFGKYFGPSTLVTAAFIGPGTVTVCTIAGNTSGYTLLWALLFSVIATIILQEMTARLGLVTRKGFGEAIRQELKNPIIRNSAILLVASAILIGNAAYQGGNISGAVLGVEAMFPNSSWLKTNQTLKIAPIIIAGIAFGCMFAGKLKIIERTLILLVIVLSIVFLTTAFLVQPNWSELLSGLLIPAVPNDQWLLVIGLIGTTIVPYNLFLHASVVQKKYKNVTQLSDLRKENRTAIIVGGLISMSIVITSAGSLYGAGGISNAADMAVQLQPLLGNWSVYFLGSGLFAAGISSAITAPLAAAYAAKGIFGWEGDLRSIKFRAVWMSVLVLGLIATLVGGSPVAIIQFAQVANGILLPLVAAFLIYLMNTSGLLGSYVNSASQNIASILVLIVTIAIGLKSLHTVFNIF
jgi:NRAMP (natural resistance-associated macrophage protein)-like metal ion transporter